MVLRQHQPGVGLVVAEDDVVARPQPLDEVGLQQQRLGLAAGGDDLEVPRFVDHAPEAFRQPRKLGVGRDAPLQRPRLADVKGVALGVEHPVHARRQGQGGQRRLDDLEALHRRWTGGVHLNDVGHALRLGVRRNAPQGGVLHRSCGKLCGRMVVAGARVVRL